MKSRMRSLLKSRKAQFYILSGFVIVGILYSVGRWIEPPTIIDTSTVALLEEPFIFNNLKEKALLTTNAAKSCEELRYNLDEYKNFVTNYVTSKNLNLNLNYSMSPCFPEPPLFPVVIQVRMQLLSPRANLWSNFTMNWVPS